MVDEGAQIERLLLGETPDDVQARWRAHEEGCGVCHKTMAMQRTTACPGAQDCLLDYIEAVARRDGLNPRVFVSWEKSYRAR